MDTNWFVVFVAAVQAAASIAIAWFALSTWKATRLYAKVAGLSLMIEATLKSRGAADDYKAWVRVLRVLGKEPLFGEAYGALEDRMAMSARNDETER